MSARLTLRDQQYEVRSGMTVRDALRQLGLQPEALLATRRGELLTDDEILRDDDEIRLVAVISGGSAAAGAAGR